MSSPLLRVAALAAGLSLLLGAATAGTALADPAAAAGPAARVVPAAARGGAPPASAVLTLLNGDRLLTGSAGGGRPSDVVLRSPGSGLAGDRSTTSDRRPSPPEPVRRRSPFSSVSTALAGGAPPRAAAGTT